MIPIVYLPLKAFRRGIPHHAAQSWPDAAFAHGGKARGEYDYRSITGFGRIVGEGLEAFVFRLTGSGRYHDLFESCARNQAARTGNWDR